MTVPADNTAVLTYGTSKDEVKEAIGKVRRMERITKEALKYRAPSGNRQADGPQSGAAAGPHIDGEARIIPDAEPKILDVQRAADNTEPLLKAVGADDLSRMVRDAEQRAQAKGKEEDGYDL